LFREIVVDYVRKLLIKTQKINYELRRHTKSAIIIE
jgi:hypothetical protein